MCVCSSTFDHSCCNPSFFFGRFRCHSYPAPPILPSQRTNPWQCCRTGLGHLETFCAMGTWRFPKCWVLAWVWWKTSCTTWGRTKPCKWWGYLPYINWCKISSINSRCTSKYVQTPFDGQIMYSRNDEFCPSSRISNGRTADWRQQRAVVCEKTRGTCALRLFHTTLCTGHELAGCSGRDILELGMKLLPYQEASKPLKSNQFGTNERCWWQPWLYSCWRWFMTSTHKVIRRCIGSRPQFRSLTSFLCFRPLKLSNSHHLPPRYGPKTAPDRT